MKRLNKGRNLRLNKALKPLLLAAALLALPGCWNRKELNEISIATAFGFDAREDRYLVSVQLVNASEIADKQGGGGRVPVVTVQQSTGRTIFESIRAMTTTTPRKIYSSHLRILVIGEDMARAGIAKLLDGLSRDHELRTDFYIIVARGTKASDILQVLTPLEKLPTDKMFSSLEASQRNWGITARVDLHELINDLVDKGVDPVLAGIVIEGSNEIGRTDANLDSVRPPATLKYQGLAVFRKDKLVGWLNDEQSKGYNYIRGTLKSTIVRLPCRKGGELAVELIHTSHGIKGKIRDGKPEIEVRLSAEGNIGEVECAINLNTPRAIPLLEAELSEAIKENMEATIAQAKAYRSDIFGFGSAIHRADYRAWNRMKDRWDDEFVHLPVHVTVKAKIRRTGSVVESFLERMEDS
ncbi:Ger(x)C family spore germination protein [Cohnella sp. JJ-181]|uniref:Ger(x)C family spore germination protein n=1 Tax=Cohnella rhizoplanae TaxID=2974897 RepID=UPI0022FF9965|nr:Ger(x)C family spore germination protein [Cohnella sp. JJ-181]CAI6083514.1 Spore germination protein B3 [Cohnella sp. JJ-181]